MKKILLSLVAIIFCINSQAQGYGITNLSATPVDGGIMVHISFYYAVVTQYQSQVITIEGNQVNLDACYWATSLQLETTISNDVFVALPNSSTYIVKATAFIKDQQDGECDYSNPYSSSTTLKTTDFEGDLNSIQIFPNPITKGILNIESKLIKINSIKVYNVMGVLVIETINLQNDLSNLKSGMYFVEISTEIGKVTEKLLVRN